VLRHFPESLPAIPQNYSRSKAAPPGQEGDEEERKEITLGETEIPRVSRCNGFGKAILEG
jgi:hypothetical protein